MKLFLDSANIEEIEKAYSLGIIDGVTTNPSLIKKAYNEHKKSKGKKKFSMEEYIIQILSIAKGTPVSLEVTKTGYDDMVEEGISLYQRFNPVANNAVIKIPVNTSLTGKTKTSDGIRAIKTLSQNKIPVNCTLVFTPEQALMAAKAGAIMVSPFVGRVDDYIRTQHGIGFEKSDYFPQEGIIKSGAHVQDNGIVSGVDLIKQIVAIFKNYGLKTQVLAASIRNQRQLREVAVAGAHIATMPFEVLQQALNHAKTIEGMKTFTDDVISEYAKLATKRK